MELTQRLGPTKRLSNGAAASAQTQIKPKFPNRTTKTNQKLVVFPTEAEEEVIEVVPEDQTVEGTILPIRVIRRVTAYCIASGFNMLELREYLESKRKALNIHTKRVDEVLYCPWFPELSNTLSLRLNDFVLGSANMPAASPEKTFEIEEHPFYIDDEGKIDRGDLFFFDYGVVVFWGLTQKEEEQMVQELSIFSKEPLSQRDIEIENLKFRYDPLGTPRIFDDIITLKMNHYMVKMTISHALAQSVKLSVFEELIENTITSTQFIPQQMALTGKVHLSRKNITKKVGLLFVMRIHVNLVSNVLDTPEIFWAEPKWESLYKAARAYLEISQRVEVLNQRTAVISDLLDMLKDHLTSRQGEKLEWIVIILIAIEIIIGIIMIIVESAKA